VNKEFSKGIEVVTTGFVTKGDKILLARNLERPDIWVFPGGHVEPGEKILESCEREIEEEIGLDIKAIKIFNFGEAILTKSHFIFFDVLLEVVEPERKINFDGEDLLDYDWFTIEEASKLKVSDVFKDKLGDFRKYLKDK
jgi:ADP-ribose pyrophosphatase YjhB (NUDIX family)